MLTIIEPDLIVGAVADGVYQQAKEELMAEDNEKRPEELTKDLDNSELDDKDLEGASGGGSGDDR
ncbi:MAG: hypothetical protein ACJ76N_29475 [Thermoanaerobaculia bacterium]